MCHDPGASLWPGTDNSHPIYVGGQVLCWSEQHRGVHCIRRNGCCREGEREEKENTQSQNYVSLVSQISADPSDINVLPEYSDDPRVVQNLLDGVNRTRDDLHMWLAPFFPGRPHTVTLTFTSHTTLAMVRIWVSATVPLSECIQCICA